MLNSVNAISVVKKAPELSYLPAVCDPKREGDRGSPPVKDVIRELFEKLEQRGVRYCHWKSNIRLMDALSGSDDLDLLVAREDAAAFQSALLEIGFKLARSRGGLDHPGVFHALGLDEKTGAIVHVHAYTQIVTGDSLVKSYRFAVEDVLLDNTHQLHGVRVPSPDAELALFLVRFALKYRNLAEILMVNRNYDVAIEELDWLCSAADAAHSAELCAKMFPTIDPPLFRRLIQVIGSEGSTIERIRIGRLVGSRLASRRRLGVVGATASRLWRIIVLLSARFYKKKDLVLQSGGAIVAFVGPKASGKSTLTSALARRLGEHLDVEIIHAGKPPATMLSMIPRAMIPLARRIFSSERPGEYEKAERRQEKTYSYLYVLRMVLAAYDRRKLLLRAMREATAGRIVISDRYPSEVPGAIDSSAFDDDAVARCNSALKRRLMLWERSLNRALPAPDMVIRLMAPLESTLVRDQQRDKEGGPDADALRRRWELETQAYLAGANVVRIDTSQPLDATISAVVCSVWRRL